MGLKPERTTLKKDMTDPMLRRIYSPPASHGFTRRGGGASITIIPAEREDCSQDLYSVGCVCQSVDF